MRRKIEYRITEEDHGSVGDFLKKVHGLSTRQIRGFRDNGNLKMDGRAVGMRDSIKGHHMLEIYWDTEEPCSLPPNDLKIGVIYEDADILVVNKPSGMPTHPSLNHENDTLAGAVTGHWLRQGESHRFRSIGRLDRETSGLMVIGKNAWAALMLEQQQRNHRMYRCYSAMVEGHLQNMRGTISAPMDRVPGSIVLRQTDPHGQYAITDYEVACMMQDHTGVCVRLTTGRTHQIRVHMASIGHPLIGDGLYNLKYKESQDCSAKKEPDMHLALRSSELYLIHPVLQIPMRWKIDPIWEDYRRAVTKMS